jgi:transposase
MVQQMFTRKKSNSRKRKPVASLPVLRPNVAGIDIGSRRHWVAGPVSADGSRNVREFGTTTPQLQELVDWLLEQAVESVAMESTSVYWIPVYELLESHGIEVLLVNARQLSNVPGRKTDVLDCQWIQLLHSCGLLRGSFRPDEAICAVRALKRQWSNLVAERTKAVQWMEKALDQMNVQVHRAVSELTGKTGMSIVRAIVDGERDPLKLAEYRDKRCKRSLDEIAEHLTGNWRKEHLFNLEMALRFYDQIQRMIELYDERMIEEVEYLQPPDRQGETIPPHPNPNKEKVFKLRGDQNMRTALWRLTGVDLTRIDGINVETAQLVVTECGFDLSAFPTEKKFVSWLRAAPRHGITGGKPLKSKKNGMGATRIAGALRMAALSLQRSKSALGAYFRRIARRKGASVAIFATARKLATLIYRMLRYGQDYVDIGEQAFEEQFRVKRLAGLKASATSLGYCLVPIEEAVQVSG